MTRIKGPWMPSYDNQHDTKNKKVLVWLPNVQSTRQKKKNLRIKARRIIDSNDPLVVAVGDRVIHSVCEEPDPEYAALHLFCAALDASEDTGESWATCMTYLMDKFEGTASQSAAKEEHVEEPKRTRDQGGSLLRRLLRGLTPRAFRASNAVAAETGVNQSTSVSVGEHRREGRTDSAISDYQGFGADEESDQRRV